MKRYCIAAIRTYPTIFMVQYNQDFMTLILLGRFGGNMKRVILISILMLCLFTPMNSQAQATPIGVDLECDESTIGINVPPEQNQPVSVTCTVTNTGLVNENIDLDSEVVENDFALSLSESSFELEAGEDATFIATFSASPRISVTSSDYNISARVVSAGPEPILIPLGQLGSVSEVGGTVSSLAYSRIDLEVSNPSTRNIEVKETTQIIFTVFNDGNRMDTVEVMVTNEQEIKDAGFTFVGDSFVRGSVDSGQSSGGEIILTAPDDASSDISVEVKLRAYSKLDSNAEPSEVSVKVVVAASSGGGGSIGLESFADEDSMIMIGMGVGGFIGVILLLVVISRLTKKTGKRKIAAKVAKKAAKTERRTNKSAKRVKNAKPVVQEETLDDDFDDDFDLDDDFDFDDI